MYTILINLDKSLDDLGSGKLLFYPYVRDKKVKIFTKTKEKELNEIFEDVKLHLESMEIVEKEWQVLFLINQNTSNIIKLIFKIKGLPHRMDGQPFLSFLKILYIYLFTFAMITSLLL